MISWHKGHGMKCGCGAARALVWVLVLAAAAVGTGCGAKAPYRVSEPPPPTAEQLRSLGRIELADSLAGAGGGRASAAPRVWIGIPDRRLEGAAFGTALGAAAGLIASAVIVGSASGEDELDSRAGTIGATFIGATVGGAVIGAFLGAPGPDAHAAAARLRRHAAAVDVTRLVREGAAASAKLQTYGPGRPWVGGRLGAQRGAGGTITVQVVAYGTRSAGGSRARPFVAVRTRLADASTGRMIYDSTSDLRGAERRFHHWAYGDGADFRKEIESLARELGTRCVDRALTPRG